jgi:NAD(P)-dependent dehydrogenase (short-subunit alcohol dehydrogenase family)
MAKKIIDTLTELFSLEGRVGIVTGGSSGIGLAIASLLADAGAKIYAVSDRISKAEDESYSANKNIIHVLLDITSKDEAKKLITEIGNKEGLDFLVNNAGITFKGKAEKYDLDRWDFIHKVNVDAVFYLSQFAYPYLKESKFIGRIVNISSMAAHLGFSEVVPYCSTKAAVLGITRGLAVEWVNDNILVNSVAPGWFPSKMTQQVMDEERKKKILNRMPLHRFGETKDIGAMVLFLLSNGAKYITGQDFAVDGGTLSYGY